MFLESLAFVLFFFFNDTATTEIYTLSLTTLFRSYSDRLGRRRTIGLALAGAVLTVPVWAFAPTLDRKSTRLNSSHGYISYAVFCLKKKKRIVVSRAREPRRILGPIGYHCAVHHLL